MSGLFRRESGAYCDPMDVPTLARKLGTTAHISSLLRKARRLGLTTPRDLETLAVQRGCRYYQRGDECGVAKANATEFSDEELAIALLHPGQPWSPQTIRLGAAMLHAPGNSMRVLGRLARMERCEAVVRYVAEAGRRFEPDEPWWSDLLAALPQSPLIPSGVLPHPTRFVAMTGVTRRGRETVTQWIRPRAMARSVVHG